MTQGEVLAHTPLHSARHSSYDDAILPKTESLQQSGAGPGRGSSDKWQTRTQGESRGESLARLSRSQVRGEQ